MATFLARLESENVGQRQREAHRSAVERLAEYMRPRAPEQATATDLRAFIAYLSELGVSAQSQGVYRAVLERWLTHVAHLAPAADSEAGSDDTILSGDAVTTEMPVPSQADPVDFDQTYPLNMPRPPLPDWSVAFAAPPPPHAPDAFRAPEPAFLHDAAPVTEAPAPPAAADATASSPSSTPASTSPFAPVGNETMLATFQPPPSFAGEAREDAMSAFRPIADAPASAFSPASAFASAESAPLPACSGTSAFSVGPAEPSPFAPVGPGGPGGPGGDPDSDPGAQQPAAPRPRVFAHPVAPMAAPPSALAPPPMPTASTRPSSSGTTEHAATTGASIPLAGHDDTRGMLTSFSDADGTRARKPAVKLEETLPAWGLRQNGSERNDLSLSQIRDLVVRGIITPQTQVRRPGGDWMRAGEYHPLRSVFMQAAEMRAAATRVPGAAVAAAQDPFGAALRAWSCAAVSCALASMAWWLGAMVIGREVSALGVVPGLVAGLFGTAVAGDRLVHRMGTGAAFAVAGVLVARLLVWKTVTAGVLATGADDLGAFATSHAGIVGLGMAAACGAMAALVPWAMGALGRK